MATSVSTSSEISQPAATSRVRSLRRLLGYSFQFLCMAGAGGCLLLMLLMIGGVLLRGLISVQWSSLQSPLLGSFLLAAMAVAMALPVALGTAVFLEEYSKRSFVAKLLQANINNLANVPSIVFGVAALAILFRFSASANLLTSALTLAVVILPLAIHVVQKALAEVPVEMRSASIALGATQWQTIWRQVLPAAIPGIVAGGLTTMGRSLGEAAPLLVIGFGLLAMGGSEGSQASALPVQIFHWAKGGNADLAAGGVAVLILVLLLLNLLALFLRKRFARAPARSPYR